jgi:hypothetical protein
MDPSIIRFSQRTVRGSFHFVPLKYQPILVVQFKSEGDEEEVFCTYDNHQLLSAMVRQATGDAKRQQLQVQLQVADTPTVDFDAFHGEKWTLQLCFMVTRLNPTNRGGVYTLSIKPATFRALVALKCALQGGDFPLKGSVDEPIVGTQFRESDVSAKGFRKFVPISTETAQQALNDKLNSVSRNEIYLAATEPGQKFYHPQLADFLLQFGTDSLRITAAKFLPECHLKKAADYTDEDRLQDRQAADFDDACAMDMWYAQLEQYEIVAVPGEEGNYERPPVLERTTVPVGEPRQEQEQSWDTTIAY